MCPVSFHLGRKSILSAGFCMHWCTAPPWGCTCAPIGLFGTLWALCSQLMIPFLFMIYIPVLCLTSQFPSTSPSSSALGVCIHFILNCLSHVPLLYDGLLPFRYLTALHYSSLRFTFFIVIRVIQSCHLLVCLFIYRHFTAKLAISEYDRWHLFVTYYAYLILTYCWFDPSIVHSLS